MVVGVYGTLRGAQDGGEGREQGDDGGGAHGVDGVGQQRCMWEWQRAAAPLYDRAPTHMPPHTFLPLRH